MTLPHTLHRAPCCATLLAVAVSIAGCGGGGSESCSTAEQNSWLRGYMLDRYYWNDSVPTAAPPAGATLAVYFKSLLFKGAGAVPADPWSGYESNTAYERFFGAGEALDYGLAVNGREQTLPLKVRYVEPESPAAAAGVQRGDSVVSINGVSAAALVAANHYAVLTPDAEGAVLDLVLDTAGGRRTLHLVAQTYALTPVPVSTVLTLPNGRKAGYLLLKEFITQGEAPVNAAFAQFRSAGASELILDLRYNGGGRISSATLLAALVAGVARDQQVFARTRNNALHQSANTTYRFSGASAAGYSRVIVLTGPRTCSASELVVNGLKPYVDVVTVGEASCGKPFGFNPVASCGNTFSVVNFEAFNSANAGRYYQGITVSCPAVDTFSGTLGNPAESLTAAALDYLHAGCSAPPTGARAAGRALQTTEAGERLGMVAD